MNKTSKKFKDPCSAITHLIAMIGAVICAFPLIGKAVHTNNSIVVFAMSVFIISMILLYGAYPVWAVNKEYLYNNADDRSRPYENEQWNSLLFIKCQ